MLDTLVGIRSDGKPYVRRISFNPWLRWYLGKTQFTVMFQPDEEQAKKFALKLGWRVTYWMVPILISASLIPNPIGTIFVVFIALNVVVPIIIHYSYETLETYPHLGKGEIVVRPRKIRMHRFSQLLPTLLFSTAWVFITKELVGFIYPSLENGVCWSIAIGIVGSLLLLGYMVLAQALDWPKLIAWEDT